VQLIVARCQVDYAGKLTAHLPLATRLILRKADGSLQVHADDKAYKPLNWMSAPCTLTRAKPLPEMGLPDEIAEVWLARNATGDTLQIAVAEILDEMSVDLGPEPGLRKDGVERHLQELLAASPQAIRQDLTLVRREHPTPIGPVDLLCRSAAGAYVAVEVKRRGDIAGVEQLARYLEVMRRDSLLGQVEGVFVAQQIKPQAKVVAASRGIDCVVVDYDELRGIDHSDERLF